MEKELIKFNENITKINKDIAKYEDEKEESNEDENNESDEPEVIVNDVDYDPEEQISIDEKPEEPVEKQENVEDVTPFEQKSVIEPEETTVKDEETQVSFC